MLEIVADSSPPAERYERAPLVYGSTKEVLQLEDQLRNEYLAIIRCLQANVEG